MPAAGSNLAQAALARIAETRPGNPRAFTSDLSADELLLVEAADCEPLGFVYGASVWNLGRRWLRRRTLGFELEQISDALHGARRSAVDGMRQEARRLGADGVVGVRLSLAFDHWGPGLIEFTAMGTAVRGRSRPGALRTPVGDVFTSHLSGQDFWRLSQTGYHPLELVMGVCVYSVGRRTIGQWLSSLWRNGELSNFTDALYAAREIAMERMQSEARNSGADGIVGVDIVEQTRGWGGHVIEFLAIGTAVRDWPQKPTPPSPEMVVPLA